MGGRQKLLSRRVGDELVIRDPDAGRVYFLNETAAEVWELARRERSADEIVAAICGQYEDATASHVRADVERCLDELAGLGLLDRGSSDGGRSLQHAK